MPRSSGGRSSYRPSRSSTRSSRSSRPQTVKRAPAPAQTSSGGSVLGNMAAIVADGFLWSTGTAVARRAVDAILGPRTVQVEYVNPEAAQPASIAAAVTGGDACVNPSKAFQDCLNTYGSEIGRCQFYLDMLSECKRKSGVAGVVAMSADDDLVF